MRKVEPGIAQSVL